MGSPNKTIVAFSHFENMWREIAEEHDFTFADLEFNRFPDKWPQIRLPNWKDQIEHKDVSVIIDAANPAYTFANYALIRWVIDYYADKVRVIMPYFPVGTMERIVDHWDIATAWYFADLMSHMPPGRQKKTSLHMMDIHAESSRFLFDSFTINAELHTVIRLIKERIDDATTIVFPDDWAKKRYGREFTEYRTATCKKRREGDQRIIELADGEEFIEWQPALIIDDLIQTWWTIGVSADMLREAWAASVSAYAPHWVFPNDSHKALAKKLDTLYTTDSIPKNIVRAAKTPNMEVISIKPSVEKLIVQG